MGVTTLQVNLNSQRMIDLGRIKKHRKIPIDSSAPGFMSDDMFARILLLEKIDEQLKLKGI
jgi:hypothetical protein